MKKLQILILLFSTIVVAQESIQIEDLKTLNNTSWKGELTYKDYTSGEQSTIETTMQIEVDRNKFITRIQYVYEPNKNYKNTVKIKKNGTYYGNEKVISNTFINGNRIIVTSYEGKDNGVKATFYTTHTFNKNTYTIVKEVQLENTEEMFVRNSYSLHRVSSK